MGYVDVSKLSCALPDGRVLFGDVSFRAGEGTAPYPLDPTRRELQTARPL